MRETKSVTMATKEKQKERAQEKNIQTKQKTEKQKVQT